MTMTSRLPINSALYLTIFGLVAGVGWQGYSSYTNLPTYDVNALKSFFDNKMQAGKARQPDNKRWTPSNFMTSFESVNLRGYVPPPPVDPTTTAGADEKPPERPVVPLADIFVIRAIIYDSKDVEDNETGVIIEYRPESNVTPPDGVAVADLAQRVQVQNSYTPGDAAALPARQGGRRSTRPVGGQRPGRGTSVMPRGAGLPDLSQRLYLNSGEECALWPPYDHIKLVDVDKNCQYATFQRTDESSAQNEWSDEKVFKTELEGLDQKTLEQLATINNEVRERIQSERRPDDSPAGPTLDSGWKASPTTVRRDDGFHLGEDFLDQVRTEPDKLFSRVGLQSYTSKTGRTTGLKVTNVPPQLRSLGVQTGDVIVSVNGKPVRSKSQAYQVGKAQYQMGKRRFDIVIISAGKEETRTYLAPQ